MYLGFFLLMLLAMAYIMATAQHDDSMDTYSANKDAISDGHKLNLHDASETRGRDDSILNHDGNDKTQSQTTATLSASMTAVDQHEDSYSGENANVHDNEKELHRNNDNGAEQMRRDQAGLSSDVHYHNNHLPRHHGGMNSEWLHKDWDNADSLDHRMGGRHNHLMHGAGGLIGHEDIHAHHGGVDLPWVVGGQH